MCGLLCLASFTHCTAPLTHVVASVCPLCLLGTDGVPLAIQTTFSLASHWLSVSCKAGLSAGTRDGRHGAPSSHQGHPNKVAGQTDPPLGQMPWGLPEASRPLHRHPAVIRLGFQTLASIEPPWSANHPRICP